MTDDEAIEMLTKTCDEVLEMLRSLNLAEGTAIERMQRLYKLTNHGGDFDVIKDKLVKTLTLTHWEARHGNAGFVVCGGPVVALGHTVSAQDYLKPSSLNQDGRNLERAREHLRQALHAIKK